MATAVRMPKLGMTMEEGTLVSWAVAPGARVEKGALLFVMESEKAESEIEATAGGVLRHVYAAPGETVPCGALLAALTPTADEPFDAERFRAEHEVARAAPRATAPPASAPPAASPSPAVARRPVAPAARKLARELGVDPDRVRGSGPGGRVVRQDVERYAAARRARVSVGAGVELEAPRDGKGDPVLLLPGFGTDISSFSLVIPPLAERHAVVGVNPRGVGLSDAPAAEAYTLSEAGADAAAVAERVVGGDVPFHVVGASLGAAAAIELALAHPTRVRSLALLTPFLLASPRLLAVLDAWTRLAAECSPDTLARALLPWLFSPTLLADATARERVARGLAAGAARVPPVTLARAAAGLRVWSGTRLDALAEIEAPTLVVAADGDLLVPDAESVARALPKARCVRVAAGHAAAVEAGATVAAALVEHLAAT